MNELAIKLHEAAIVLENDEDFYRKYTRLEHCQASTRRDAIHTALVCNRVCLSATAHKASQHGTDLREHLRRYLDDVWDMLPPSDAGTDTVALRWKELKFWEDSVKYLPVPAPQAETPPAGNGKSVQLPDDIELQTSDGVDWHVTCVPDGSIMYSMTTAGKVWNAFGKASGMGYRRQARDWAPLTSPRFTGSNPYRWKPEFTFKLLEQEAGEAKVQETPDRLSQDHAQDSLAYLDNLLETQAKETIMNNAINTAAIVITTKTLVNGVDISTVADAAIYDLIAKQEAAVADLEKIDNKPKKLVNEIAKRKAGIQALVDYLDSKEPADKADDNGANASA